MVERRSPKPDVVGSNPTWPARAKKEVMQNEEDQGFYHGKLR